MTKSSFLLRCTKKLIRAATFNTKTQIAHRRRVKNIKPGIPLEAPPSISVLVAEADPRVREECQAVLNFLGYSVLLAESPAKALKAMSKVGAEIALVDIGLSSDAHGLVTELLQSNPRAEIALLTSQSDMPRALQAIQQGASESLLKPISREGIRLVVQRLADTLKLKDENGFLREKLSALGHFGLMVGPSHQMQQVFRLINKFASSRWPVLIHGEAGTGKEMAARVIHQLGVTKDHPFIPVDCESFSESADAAETALFGSLNDDTALLKTVGSGTLFLNEVTSLPLETQVRLLRVLNEKVFRPTKSSENVPFEARAIAATSQDIKEAVKKGSFRKDLFFRLNVASISLPALRERRSDIPLLSETLLARLSAAEKGHREQSPWVLASEVLDRFLTYDWPGNIEEFESCLEHAVSVSSGPLIRISDLPSSLQNITPARESQRGDSIVPLNEMERAAIKHALEISGGDKVKAAKMLGIGKATLDRKIKKYQNSK